MVHRRQTDGKRPLGAVNRTEESGTHAWAAINQSTERQEKKAAGIQMHAITGTALCPAGPEAPLDGSNEAKSRPASICYSYTPTVFCIWRDDRSTRLFQGKRKKTRESCLSVICLATISPSRAIKNRRDPLLFTLLNRPFVSKSAGLFRLMALIFVNLITLERPCRTARLIRAQSVKISTAPA